MNTNKRIKVLVIIGFVLISLSLLYAKQDSILAYYKTTTFFCPISDENAVQISRSFCNKISIPCEDEPITQVQDSSLILLPISEAFKRKVVGFKSVHIKLNCDNGKVTGLNQLHRDPNKTNAPLSLIESYSQYSKMLNISGISQCSIISSYQVLETDRYIYEMIAFNHRGTEINNGYLLGDIGGRQIYGYVIERTHWCNEGLLPKPYSEFISLHEARKVGQELFDNEMRNMGHEPSGYSVDKITLRDKYHDITDHAWHIGFRRNDITFEAPQEEWMFIDNRGQLEEDYIDKSAPGEAPWYMTIIVNAVTGELM